MFKLPNITHPTDSGKIQQIQDFLFQFIRQLNLEMGAKAEEKSVSPAKETAAYQAADSVVEQGKSNIWTYRKWKSGVAECWFNTNVIFDAKQKIDLGFKQNDGQDMQLTYVDIALPFQFVDSPSSTCTCNWSYSEWVQSNAGANIVRVRLMGTTKSVESAVTNGTKCSVQIKGRWK